MNENNEPESEQCWRHLNLNSGKSRCPKYEQLRRFVAEEVDAGHLTPGTPLPSEQRMAAILRVARTTIRQALSKLEQDGIVTRKHGSGTYVNGTVKNHSATSSLDVFAFISPGGDQGFWAPIQAEFELASAEVNKQILSCSTYNNLDRQAHAILQLIEKGVRGVTLIPTSLPVTPAYQVRHLQKNEIPVVLCHRGIEGVEAPLVAIPFKEVGQKVAHLLLKNGHRRIAFYSLHQKNQASNEYEAGIREVMRNAGTDLAPEMMYWGETISPDPEKQSGSLSCSLKRMLADPNPPTAIFASFDSLAERIYMLLTEMGISVPEQVSIVGFGGSKREGVIRERLTSITIDEKEIGSQAARLLKEMNTKKRSIFDTEVISVATQISTGSTVRSITSR